MLQAEAYKPGILMCRLVVETRYKDVKIKLKGLLGDRAVTHMEERHADWSGISIYREKEQRDTVN